MPTGPRAGRYDSKSYVDTTIMKLMVADLVEAATPKRAAPIFTDDYAPIETMAF